MTQADIVELSSYLHSMHSILPPAAYGRNSVWGCKLSYYNATLHNEEDVLCIICTEQFSDVIKWCRASSAYSDAQNKGPFLEQGNLCKEVIAKDHSYFPNVVK